MVAAPDRSEVDRLAQVQKLAEEIDLTCEQLAKMIDEAKPSSRGKITLVLNLFSRIVDREDFYEIEERLTKEELAKLRLELGPMWSYSDDNPTGHYKLNLESNFDRELANKVLSVNNFERQSRKDSDLADTSDDGHYMNFRNETYNGESFRWTGAWRVPANGILEFDYVSSERPRNDTVVLSKDYFFELLSDLADENITDSEKLANVLQPYTRDEYFSTEQVRQIVRKFHESDARVEAVVMCHRRVADLENFLKVIMVELRTLSNGGEEYVWEDDDVPTAEHDREINVVLSRLGWLNCWNPLDADVMYRLELENRDQNLVAQCLVELAVKEPGENWQGEHMNGKEFELPSTWIKEVPKKGFLEVHYYTDHLSDETMKSKSKRGDNFDVRVKWFKRSLCYTEGMDIQDDAYEGIKRDDMPRHRNWTITRRMPVHRIVADVMGQDAWLQQQNLRWLQRRGYHLVDHEGGLDNIDGTAMMQCQRSDTMLNLHDMLQREKSKAVEQGRLPAPIRLRSADLPISRTGSETSSGMDVGGEADSFRHEPVEPIPE